MQTYWNFITNDPSHKKYFNFDLVKNPFSSIKGTENMAKHWAKGLLHLHKNASAVSYMRKGGRKVYNITRLTK